MSISYYILASLLTLSARNIGIKKKPSYRNRRLLNKVTRVHENTYVLTDFNHETDRDTNNIYIILHINTFIREKKDRNGNTAMTDRLFLILGGGGGVGYSHILGI